MRGQKRGQNEKAKRKVADFSDLKILSVIRLGLEPKTPTLKVLCSTD